MSQLFQMIARRRDLMIIVAMKCFIALAQGNIAFFNINYQIVNYSIYPVAEPNATFFPVPVKFSPFIPGLFQFH